MALHPYSASDWVAALQFRMASGLNPALHPDVACRQKRLYNATKACRLRRLYNAIPACMNDWLDKLFWLAVQAGFTSPYRLAEIPGLTQQCGLQYDMALHSKMVCKCHWLYSCSRLASLNWLDNNAWLAPMSGFTHLRGSLAFAHWLYESPWLARLLGFTLAGG